MGYLGAVTFPVLPGQEDRVRNFEQEVAQHQGEWERLSNWPADQPPPSPPPMVFEWRA